MVCLFACKPVHTKKAISDRTRAREFRIWNLTSRSFWPFLCKEETEQGRFAVHLARDTACFCLPPPLAYSMSSNIAQHLQQLKQNNLSSLSLSSLGFPLENSANGICLSSSSSSFPLYSTLRENGTGKGGRPGPGMDIAAGIGYNGFFLSL